MGNIAADMLADGGGDAGDAGLGDAADAFFGGLSGGSVSMSVEAGGAGLAATVPPALGDGTWHRRPALADELAHVAAARARVAAADAYGRAGAARLRV